MPVKTHDCVESVLECNPGMSEDRAWAICQDEIDAESAEVATRDKINIEAEALDEFASTNEDWQAVDGGWINAAEQLGVFDGLEAQTGSGVPDNAVDISDPSEAPEGADIITGPQGGTYYVPPDEGDGTDDGGDSGTRGATTTDELVENFDGDSAPDGLDVTAAESISPLDDADIESGHDSEAMRVAEMPDGSHAFVRLGAESEEDIENTVAVGEAYNSLLDTSADLYHDEATDAVVTEEVEGQLGTDVDLGVTNEDSFYDAAGASLLTGNWDFTDDNIMIDDDGDVHVFDYDSGGEPMTGDESLTDEFANIVAITATNLGLGGGRFVSPEDVQADIRAAAEELADGVGEDFIDSLPEDSPMRENVRAIQDGDFEW